MHTQTIITKPSEVWFLVADESGGVNPERIPVTSPFRIGRKEGFDLCLSSQNVSGLHAEIIEEDGQLWLYDLNSTNGTFLNGERIRERIRLRENDSVVFGNCTFGVGVESTGTSRRPLATIANEQLEPAETAEEKFHRLLDSGTTPFFQPIYEITGVTKRRIGFEVLGRSRMFGLRTPDQMFAEAMKFEKEATLSRVLRQRGIEAAEAGLPPDQMLFINTHPAELERGDLKDSLHEIRESFPTRQIVLELPESILNAPEAFAEVRSVLLNLGIHLAIHDFGAGQIRLSELSEMAPDIVKFDCALIQGINKASSKRQRLVAAMTKMVTELGIIAMAEYIELPGEHETLRQLGVHYAQGFHYGRPIDVSKVSLNENEGSERSVISQSPNDGKLSNRNLLKELKRVDRSERTSSANPSHQIKDAQWLLGQPKGSFTIQMTMCSFEHRATEFVARQSRPGDYAVYRKRGRISEWFVVVFGVYNDRETAKADSVELKTAGVTPWLRTLAAVHTDIKAAHAEK